MKRNKNASRDDEDAFMVMNQATGEFISRKAPARKPGRFSVGNGFMPGLETATAYSSKASAHVAVYALRKELGHFEYVVARRKEFEALLNATKPAPEPVADTQVLLTEPEELTVEEPAPAPEPQTAMTPQDLADARNAYYSAMMSFSAADELRAVERSKFRAARAHLRFVEESCACKHQPKGTP